MANWRPPGLINPYPEDFYKGKPYSKAKIWNDTVDSVIEALRKQGDHCPKLTHSGEIICDYCLKYCSPPMTIVFIPDDQEDHNG